MGTINKAQKIVSPIFITKTSTTIFSNCLFKNIQEEKQMKILYGLVFVHYVGKLRKQQSSNSLVIWRKKVTFVDFLKMLIVVSRKRKSSKRKLLLISVNIIANLTLQQKRHYIDLVLTIFYNSIKIYEFLINVKIILDYYPQINPYVSPVGWLTFLTEEPIAFFGWFMPPFIRSYADFRATLLLLILEHLAPQVLKLRRKIRRTRF